MNRLFSSNNYPDKKSKFKNIVIKTLLIAAIIAVFVLFFVLFDFSYQNDGAEILESIKNGG